MVETCWKHNDTILRYLLIFLFFNLIKPAAKFLRTESVKCPACAVIDKSRVRHVHVMSLNLLTSRNSPVIIPRQSWRDIILASSVRPSVHTFCLSGTISHYPLVRFNSSLVQMISTMDSRYPISLVKIDPLTLEFLPLFSKGNYKAKAILAFLCDDLHISSKLLYLTTSHYRPWLPSACR